VHLPRSPRGWVAVAAFFVTLAGLVIMLASVASGGSAIGWGSGLAAVGCLMGTVALYRVRTRDMQDPPR
jgi:hypothetical protein